MAAPDFTIHQNQDDIVRVLVLDQAGAVKDLTGATIVFRIGDKRTQVFQLTKAGSITNAPGTDGYCEVALDDTDLDGITVDTYDYQFIVTDASGDVQVTNDGKMKIDHMLPAA